MTEGRSRDTLWQRLTEYLMAVSGARAVEIEQLTPLDGLGRENWLASVELDDQEESLVIQRAWARRSTWTLLEVEDEFRLLAAMQAAGVPAPEPRWYCSEAAILGGPFLITTHVTGGGVPSPEALGEMLAHIHAFRQEAGKLDFVGARSAAVGADEALDRLRTTLTASGAYRPALEFGLRWVEQRRPDPGPTVMLHGDFRASQVIADKADIKAVCGWERSRRGDAHEDLAWMGMRGHWPGNAANYRRFLNAYEQAGQRTVDRDALRIWAVIGHLRQAVRMLVLGAAYRQAGARSPSVLMAGRQAAKAELEALRLIGAGEWMANDRP